MRLRSQRDSKESQNTGSEGSTETREVDTSGQSETETGSGTNTETSSGTETGSGTDTSATGSTATEESGTTTMSENTVKTNNTNPDGTLKPQEERDAPLGEKETGAEDRTDKGNQNPTLTSEKPKTSGGMSQAGRRRAAIQAQLDLEKFNLEKARAAADIARLQLEMLRLEDTDNSDDGEEAVTANRTEKWVGEHTIVPRSIPAAEVEAVQSQPRTEGRRQEPAPHPAEKETANNDALANAIVQAINRASATSSEKPPLAACTPTAPPRYIAELHNFDGDPNEWIPFRATYRDTRVHFSDIDNVARLRRAIHGRARDAIKARLYTETDPEAIIAALERRFGRPSYLIKNEMANIDRLKPISEDARNIVKFAGVVANTATTIVQMNKPNFLHSSDLSEKIIDKMSINIRFRWFDYRATHEEPPILLALSEFLNSLCDKFEAYDSSANVKRETNGGGATRKPRGVHATTARVEEASCESEENENYDAGGTTSDEDEECEREMQHVVATHRKKEMKDAPCPACEKDHPLKSCALFTDVDVEKRWEMVKKMRVCFRCLRNARHRAFNCKAKPCSKCRRAHHVLLHGDSAPEKQEDENREKKIASVNTLTATRAYLKIAPVEISGPLGTKQLFALLDEGSTVTLLEKSVAEEIGARGPREELHIEGVGGQRIRDATSRRLDLKIRGLYCREYEDMTASTIEKLNLAPQAVKKRDLEDCPHLEDVPYELTYDTAKPSLLIGQDNWHLIVSRDVRSGSKSRPVASLTRLGWVLHGCNTSIAKPVRTVHVINHLTHVERLIKEHFAIDSLGIAAKRPANDPEERALNILKSTCKYLPEEKRFEAGLLWRADDTKMPESRENAMKRLIGIEKKMKKDENFNLEYRKQMKNLIDSGYAEIVDYAPTSPRTWYLPHFAVVHPQKGKVRLVFDAAAKSRGRSLNDELLSGPDLLQSLFGVLLRFREGPIAVMADIKEMFLRIKIREPDRDSLRFLWRENEGEPAKEYRMTALIFGATSSPCTAIYVKDHNADLASEEYPAAAKAIRRNHYMDDYLQSFYDAASARETATQVDAIHKKAGFHLRGWASNVDIIENLTEPCNVSENKQLGGTTAIEKTLGLRWNVKEDIFTFALNMRNTPEEALTGRRAPTKREITSAVMSVYDPLGLASPQLIQGKMLIQDLWRTGVGWDEPVLPEQDQRWRTWLSGLQALPRLHVPRCVSRTDREAELHTFCDASEKAYAAAVYLRIEHEDHIEISLLAGKARVSPNKPTSIPRLELQAALMGARLATTIQAEIDKKITRRVYWSDSRTVLAWIKSDPRTFKTFVAHRLAEIEDHTKCNEWRWLPTKENVADDATRDAPEPFDANHRWFTGPAFLQQPESEWPVDRSAKTPPVITGEERLQTHTIRRITVETPEPTRFSTWLRLLRATARFLHCVTVWKSLRKTKMVNAHIKQKPKDPSWRKHDRKGQKNTATPLAPASARKRESDCPLAPASARKRLPGYPATNATPLAHTYELPPIPEEIMKNAEDRLIQIVQRDCFQKEMKTLDKGQHIEKGSPLHKLNISLRDGILVLRTRVGAAEYLPPDYTSPKVLHGKHHITRLLIEDYHRRFNHGNHHTVMNELRQRFYITSLRRTVKAITTKCQWCRKHKSTPREAPVGCLPAERLAMGTYPFTHTAVDYFGPMIIKIGRRREKRWCALFTCLTTRAIHLELAASLTTDSMLLALRRLSARRGQPRTMYSDNGTNFVGASKELIRDLNEDIAGRTKITWKFSPAGAPHMNGVCERMVRSVKAALHATLKEREPNEETLHTLLLEAEHVINSRPLTPVSVDPDDEESLTPNHFLIGRSNGAHSFGDYKETRLDSNWKVAQRLADKFWQRWLKEYLPTISVTRGNRPYTEPAIGDVVIIADSSLPRGVWPKGIITKKYPGPDGHTRIVEVKTRAGSFKRPMTRIIKLTSEEQRVATPITIGAERTEGETVSDQNDA